MNKYFQIIVFMTSWEGFESHTLYRYVRELNPLNTKSVQTSAFFTFRKSFHNENKHIFSPNGIPDVLGRILISPPIPLSSRVRPFEYQEGTSLGSFTFRKSFHKENKYICSTKIIPDVLGRIWISPP